MSEAGFRTMAERLRARRAERQNVPAAAPFHGDQIAPRSPDGVPCWFIPATAVIERLEQLHPRGAA